jgi:hypothetical protein
LFIHGFASQLARLAYLPRLSWGMAEASNLYYQIPQEDDPYKPSEVSIEVLFNTNISTVLPSGIKARSPNYVTMGPGNRRHRFRGTSVRLLWQYHVDSWTNTFAGQLPMKFTYTRFADVRSRLMVENLIPIIQCQGILARFASGATNSLLENLGQNLNIVDARLAAEAYGRPVTYTVTNGVWLPSDSPALIALVNMRRREVESEQNNSAHPRNPAIMFLVFAAAFVAPVVILYSSNVRRRAAAASMRNKL